MSIPTNTSTSSSSSSNLDSKQLELSKSVKQWKLSSEEELRIEVGSEYKVTVQLTKGTAEVFGTELSIDHVYTFIDNKFAIFTWFGCDLTIIGTPKVVYTATETPMKSYINSHGLILHPKRQQAKTDTSLTGPRVLIVGPTDSGRTSLSKMLLSWAVRSGFKPVFVDLDCGQNLISIPGAIAATSVEHPISPETTNESLTVKSPLSFFYGDVTPQKNQELYFKLVERLAQSVNNRLQAVDIVRQSGIVVNTTGWIDGAGNEIILRIVQAFQIDTLLVVGHERLYAELKSESKLGSSVHIEKLAKSGGVVSRDQTVRKNSRMKAIKEYFYGPNHDLNPHQKVLFFKDVNIWKPGGGPVAPNTTLPIGSKRLIDPNALAKVIPTLDLVNSILAVSFAVDPNNLHDSPTAGFVYVSAVDMGKKCLTILCPAPGPLPSMHFINGVIKFLDQ